jgi:hypothetical protein
MELFKSDWLREAPRPAFGPYHQRRFAQRYGRRPVLHANALPAHVLRPAPLPSAASAPQYDRAA